MSSLSVPMALNQRSSVGKLGRHVFQRRIASLRQENMELLEDIQISQSLHRGGFVTCLDMDRIEDRYLLAGGSDAIISVYDLSPWGTEHRLGTTAQRHGTPSSFQTSVHKPVAQSIRAPPGSNDNEVDDVPPGHSHSIISAQFYPVDTGAFVSSSAEGSIMVWDTQTLTPVVRWRPFVTCRCFDMTGTQPLLLAVGSDRSTSVKLVDLRSGASSHSLVGHNGGISVTRWSPTCGTVLASGGLDGSIRLWDIRKSGSNACLTILNRDDHNDTSISHPYFPTYAHLRSNLKKKKNLNKVLAPNNYQRAESNAFVSHGGPVSAISFTPSGHFLISTGRDGRLQQWDLRIGSGQLVPTQFSISASNEPAVSKNEKVPLIVTETLAWVGHGQRLLGYSLERGGMPVQVLQGHLHNVTSLTTQEGWMRLISGGKDGMILLWGSGKTKRKRPLCVHNGNNHEAKRAREATEDRDNW